MHHSAKIPEALHQTDYTSNGTEFNLKAIIEKINNRY